MRSPSCCLAEPEQVKKELIGQISAVLGPDYDVATHFTPSYRPWRQRIAFVPDADFFHSVKDGKASVVTDEIERFVEDGIQLKSGKTLAGRHHRHRDRLQPLRRSATSLSPSTASRSISPTTVTYRGMMFTGVPNMAWVFGYFRASWTLRTDLVAEFVCRLLDAYEEQRA